MPRLSVSDVAEKHLSRWFEGLMTGEIPLWALPPSVAAFFHAGYFEGRESRQDEIDTINHSSQQGEIDRLNHLADVYWAEAHLTKDQRRERILQRLDAGLQAADAETWDRIESELHEALADRQLNIHQFELEPGQAPEIVSRNDGSSSAASGTRREAA